MPYKGTDPTDWDNLPSAMREEMSPEFWASLSDEERTERLTFPTDEVSQDAQKASRLLGDAPE